MQRLKQLLRKGAAAVSAAMMLTAVQLPDITASAAEPVLRMHLLGGGSVVGIGYQLESPDGLAGCQVTLDGESVTLSEDGTFEAYEYAAYMTQPHTVTVRKGGRQILKKETTVCSYLNTLLADSESGAYHNAAKAMLVYGGAAQAYFGIDTEHPADAGIDKDGLPMQDIPEDNPPLAKMKVTMEGFSNVPVRYTGMNLSLQSEIQFSLFFEPKAEFTAKEAEEYLKACTFGGEPSVLTPYGENGYRMSCTVNVKDLSETIIFEDPESGPTEFRPTQYLYLAEQSGEEALIRICETLYSYSEFLRNYDNAVWWNDRNTIREIEMQMDEYEDWRLVENFWPELDYSTGKDVMFDEDDNKMFELSLPEQLFIERTDKSGQTVKIPVLKEDYELIGGSWGNEWGRTEYLPAWLKQTDYEAAEHTLCSGDPDWEWSHVSARFGQGNDTDVLMLYFTLYWTLDARFGIQSLKLDENGKLTVRTSICNENDYGGGEEIYAYRFELPKGALSGAWVPEDSGEQPPEEDAVIRGVHLDTDYYYDLEKIKEYADEWIYNWEPEPDMLTKDPEAFRASLPDTLCIERTDGTGRAVQIPVLKQEKYDGWYCEFEDNPWWYQQYEGPDWLKKNDYKAAERNLCDPIAGMQRVSAHFEQGDATDVLMLYFTWNFMDGDLELQGLQFDENGELTVRTAFCRTTAYGWGDDLYSYRLELPHGALTDALQPEESVEEQPAIREIGLIMDWYYDYEQCVGGLGISEGDEGWPEPGSEVLVKNPAKFESSIPRQLVIEKTDETGQTAEIPVLSKEHCLIDVDRMYDPVDRMYDPYTYDICTWSDAPSWLKQEDYEAAQKSYPAKNGVSVKLEQGEETDVLLIYISLSEPYGDYGLQKLQLDENGKLTVYAAYCMLHDYGSPMIYASCLELPHGALS